MADIFISIFLLKLEIYCQGILQKLTFPTNWILFSFIYLFICLFFANRVIDILKKLPNQIQNSKTGKKRLNWMILEIREGKRI